MWLILYDDCKNLILNIFYMMHDLYILKCIFKSLVTSLNWLNPSECRLMARRHWHTTIQHRPCGRLARFLNGSHCDIWASVLGCHFRNLVRGWIVVRACFHHWVNFQIWFIGFPLIIKTNSFTSWAGSWSQSIWFIIFFGFISHFKVRCSLLIFEFLGYFIRWFSTFIIQLILACSHEIFWSLWTNFSKFKMMSFQIFFDFIIFLFLRLDLPHIISTIWVKELGLLFTNMLGQDIWSFNAEIHVSHSLNEFASTFSSSFIIVCMLHRGFIYWFSWFFYWWSYKFKLCFPHFLFLFFSLF